MGVDFEEMTLQFSACRRRPAERIEFSLSAFGEAVALRSGDPVSRGDNAYGIAPADGWRVGTRYELQVAPSVSGPLGTGQVQTLSFSTVVPVLEGSAPESGTASVGVDFEEMTLQFSAPVDADQLNESSFSLSAFGEAVALRSGDPVSRGDNAYGIAPADGWRVGTRYELQVAPSVSGPLGTGQVQTLSFSTVVPVLEGSAPESGTASVGVDFEEMTLQFSAPVDADQLNESSFSLSAFGEAVALRSGDPVSRGDNAYGIAPADGWRVGTRYELQVAPSVSGPLGTGQVQTLSFSTVVPVLEGSAPESGTASVGVDFEEMTLQFSAPVDADQLNESSFSLSAFGEAVALRSGDPVSRGDNAYGIAPADGWRA